MSVPQPGHATVHARYENSVHESKGGRFSTRHITPSASTLSRFFVLLHFGSFRERFVVRGEQCAVRWISRQSQAWCSVEFWERQLVPASGHFRHHFPSGRLAEFGAIFGLQGQLHVGHFYDSPFPACVHGIALFVRRAGSCRTVGRGQLCSSHSPLRAFLPRLVLDHALRRLPAPRSRVDT